METYPQDWWLNLLTWRVGPFDDGQEGEVYITGDALWAHLYFKDGAPYHEF